MIGVQDNVLRFFAIDHVLVSFVTIATTGTIFDLQFTKNRLATGLYPDPLEELQRSPRLPSRKTRGLLLRGGEGDRMGGEREGRGRGRGGSHLTHIARSTPDRTKTKKSIPHIPSKRH